MRYTTVWQALTKYSDKKFPKVVVSLLKILGYNVHEVTAFKLLDSKDDQK